MTDQPVGIEVVLIRLAVGEGQLAEEGVADAVHNTAFDLVAGAFGVDDDAAVDGTVDFFYLLFAISSEGKVEDLCNVGVVSVVSGNTAGFARVTIP